jgi:hypothetical protein
MIIFLFCFIKSFTQYAIVNDNDGFLNVRQEAQQNSKLTSAQELFLHLTILT